MRSPTYRRPAVVRLGALLGAMALALAACNSGTSPTAAPTIGSAPTSGTAATQAAPSAAPKTLEIAYLSFAVANSYDAPMLAAARAAAAAGNANVTVFDANLDPAQQTKQLQDAVASGKFDGILLQPLYGAGLLTDAKAAIAANIAVGNIDQILGTDFTTAASQVDGLKTNVVFVPSELGRKIGELVVKACAEKNANPCKVGYIWSVKAAALDGALKVAFDKATAVNPAIKIVAEGESFYTTPLGLKASQDMLAAHSDLSVIVGADQAITGAVQAVAAVNLQAQVALVGYGGGTIAFQDIAAGKRYGTVVQMPATEGRIGMEQLIQAIRTGKPFPGEDPLAVLPESGVCIKANAAKFLSLAEWPG